MIADTGEQFSGSVRLNQSREYSRVFQKNFRLADDSMTLLMRQNQCAHARIGFAISRKQIKRAVQRNRLKRIFRESFRKHCFQLPQVDIVVLARPGLAKLENAVVFKRLEKHWQTIIKKCASC